MGQVLDGDIYAEIAAIDIPVRVLRAKPRQEGEGMSMGGSPTPAYLASRFRHGEDILLPELSHFIPMEDPALVARHILELDALLG